MHCVTGSGWLQDKFLEQFCEDAYECCAKDRKKSLAYKHLGNLLLPLSLSFPLYLMEMHGLLHFTFDCCFTLV